jgi:ketosteroid isomerase-like protein
MIDLKQLAKQYFEAFSQKDLDRLALIYSDSVTLRDWDIDVAGKTAVLEANQKLFDSVDSINIVPLKLYEDGSTVASEIYILINSHLSLKVVDVIDFDDSGQIQNIRAYQG